VSGSGLDQSLGATTEREIRSMPALWRLLADRLDDEAVSLAASLEGASSVTFLGCGSAYISGQTAVELLRTAGLPAKAEVASDYVLRPGAPRDAGAVAIAVSRSGATNETCEAVEAFRARTNGAVVAVTCRPSSPLAALADRTIGLAEADEQAVPQTRSVSAFLVLWTLLAGRLGGEDCRDAIVAAADRIDGVAEGLWPRLEEVARGERFVLLGAGAGHRLAEEAALKLTEMGRVPSWAWRALEYRHGPLEALDEHTTVVGPIGVDLAPADLAAVEEAATAAGASVDVAVLVAPVPPAAGLLAQLYALHALSLLAARANGRNADTPTQIRPFVDDVDLSG
jgi:glutamine---fructose-6-phosphate transaminase (isomerizing)